MALSPDALIRFAAENAGRAWSTPHKSRSFGFLVDRDQLLVIPEESDSPRHVSRKAIEEFCARFNKGARTKKALGGGFNTSYLLALALAIEDVRAGEAVRFPDLPSPDELIAGTYREGSTRTVIINQFERSPEARVACIKAHGAVCSICSFDFGKVYGPEAGGLVHVHHLHPIALRSGEYEVDPIRDLRPVCPNCHAVIHLNGGCRSIEVVKEMMRQSQALQQA